MAAVVEDLDIEQGATFEFVFEWVNVDDDGNEIGPVDMTGWTARMQVRKTQQAPPLVTLTSEVGGGITLGGADGVVELLLTDQQTDLITQKALYDLEAKEPVELGGKVHRLLKGKVTPDPNITQDDDDPVVTG